MRSLPVRFRWDGIAMRPLRVAEAERHFSSGEIYALEQVQERSLKSHNAYFAALHSAWMNLPAELSDAYPTEEHFRKRLLIQAGFCDEQQIVFATKNDALKTAGLVLTRDDYCVADVQANVLTIWTAKSQSMKAMGKETFQASKEKVLELAASLIGTTPETLTKNAGQAA